MRANLWSCLFRYKCIKNIKTRVPTSARFEFFFNYYPSLNVWISLQFFIQKLSIYQKITNGFTSLIRGTKWVVVLFLDKAFFVQFFINCSISDLKKNYFNYRYGFYN